MLKRFLILVLTLAPVCAEELFPAIPMTQAQQLSQQEKRPILVEFSASWCAPCKVMQRTVFQDSAVIEYTRGHFVPIQLDLDKDKDQAQKLGVGTVPTLIVLDQGREVDRLSGLQKTEELLAWLRNVGQGPPLMQGLEQKLVQQPDSADIHHQLAEIYSERARWSDALRECLWIWDHVELVGAQNMLPVRSSYVGVLFHRLLKNYPESKTALSQRQARLQKQLETGNNGLQTIEDWLTLNRWLELEGAGADYILAHPQTFAAQQKAVFELLCRQKRWPQAGQWLKDPQERAEYVWTHRRKLEESCQELPEETAQSIKRFARTDSHRQWRDLLQALQAAQRDPEAEAIRDWIRKTDPEAQLEANGTS